MIKALFSPLLAFSAAFLEGLAGASLLLTRLGCFVCCGHSWLGALGLVWDIGFGVWCCGWAAPWRVSQVGQGLNFCFPEGFWRCQLLL